MKKSKGNKDITISLRINKDLHDRLESYSENEKVAKSKVIRLALEKYLK